MAETFTQTTLPTPQPIAPTRWQQLILRIKKVDFWVTQHARFILPIYWALLATSTHWPKLKLIDADPSQPPLLIQPDKVIHVIAFAILFTLIKRARLLTNRLPYAINCLFAFILAAGYACLDEFTQQYASRTVSFDDLAASCIGIITAYLLAVAPPSMRPISAARVHLARIVWIIIAPTLTLMTILRAGNGVTTYLYSFVAIPRPGMDKVVHFYAAFSLTLLLAAATPAGRKRPRLSILATLITIAAAAPIIELVQNQTHRAVELADIVQHMHGFFYATMLWAVYAAFRSLFAKSHLRSCEAVLLTPPTIPCPLEKQASKQLEDEKRNQKHFINFAIIVSAFTTLSRVFGLVRDSILAWAFGLSSTGDAFFVAFMIPNLFRRLFGEGALTAAFIPHYTNLLKSDPALARRFAYLILALLTILLSTITIFCEIGLYVANTFGSFEPSTHLILKLTMIMLPYMPLICCVAMISGILQVHKRFGPPAAAPVILNLTMISFAICAGIFAHRSNHFSDNKVAIVISLGVLAAGFIQIFFLLPTLFHHTKPTLIFTGTAKHLRSMLFMMLPMLIGLAVLQINTFLDTTIAYFFSMPNLTENPTAPATLFNSTINYPMQTHSVSALYYAQRLYQFPLAVFGLAIATVIFPIFASSASKILEASRTGNPTEPHRKQFQTTFHHGLRLTIFLGLPAGVGLILVREPLIRLLFERGVFTSEDTIRVAHILIGYAISVWAYSLIHVLTRAYYAHKDSLTPLKISVSMVALNLVLNLTLIWPLGAGRPRLFNRYICNHTSLHFDSLCT